YILPYTHIQPFPTRRSSDLLKGNIAEFGRDVGHIKYDVVSHKLYTVSQILQNGDDVNAGLPPPDTAEFLTIDPVTDAILRRDPQDRKSTRLNSSHEWISYAV